MDDRLPVHREQVCSRLLLSLAHVAQVECFAIAMEYHAAEASKRRGGELRVGFNQLLCVAAGFFDQRRVAVQVGDSQRWESVLPRAEQIARSAQTKVGLGQLEAVARFGKRVEPLLGLVRGRRGKDAQVTRMRSAADSPAQLM